MTIAQAFFIKQAQEAKKGGQALDAFIRANEPLMRRVVMKYLDPSDRDFDDVLQAVRLAWWDALKKWKVKDARKAKNPGSFFSQRTQWAVQDAVAKLGRERAQFPLVEPVEDSE